MATIHDLQTAYVEGRIAATFTTIWYHDCEGERYYGNTRDELMENFGCPPRQVFRAYLIPIKE